MTVPEPWKDLRQGGDKMCCWTDMVFLFFLVVKVIAFGPLFSMSLCNLLLRERKGGGFQRAALPLLLSLALCRVLQILPQPLLLHLSSSYCKAGEASV